MLKLRRGEQFSLPVQVADDIRVRVLDKFSGVRSLLGHISPPVHKLHQGQAVLPSHIGIVLTKGRGDVHDTGTVGHGDIAVAGHIVGLFPLSCRLLSGAGKEGFILPVLQILPFVSLQHLIGRGAFPASRLLLFRCLASQNLIQQSLGHIIGKTLRRLHLHISLLRVHAQSHVGGQGPGRGGPGKEKGILPHTFKPHHRRALFHGLVALGHLMTGKRRPTPGAVGHNLKPFVQQTFVPDGFQRPPLGLDKVIVIGHIRSLHVGPEAHCVGEFLPHSLVFPDALLALVNERGKTVLFDLLLAVQPQLLLHLQLHRQTVGVPSRLPGHHIPLHGPVPGNHVLDGAGFHMSDVGHAVGGGGSVVEGVDRPLPAAVHALFKNVVVSPELFDLFLPFH